MPRKKSSPRPAAPVERVVCEDAWISGPVGRPPSVRSMLAVLAGSKDGHVFSARTLAQRAGISTGSVRNFSLHPDLRPHRVRLNGRVWWGAEATVKRLASGEAGL